MKIDLEEGWVETSENGQLQRHALGSPQGFAQVAKAYLRAGWDAKYVYSFSWMGRPVIQLPDDMLRIQELIFAVNPTMIIETGVAHGGSLIYYASLFKAMGQAGRVIGIDIEIRPHNRAAIEAHLLSPYLTLVEGSSIAPEIVSHVKSLVKREDVVLVILDSNHSRDHVLAELEAYSPLVTKGSYIIATDGIMHWLDQAPRSQADWSWNNPKSAAEAFCSVHPEFSSSPPRLQFNESSIDTPEWVTYWPGAWILREK